MCLLNGREIKIKHEYYDCIRNQTIYRMCRIHFRTVHLQAKFNDEICIFIAKAQTDR